MAQSKFVLLPKEPTNLPQEFANFSLKSRIDPPIRSSYLAICIAYLESLYRLKDVEIYRSSWIAFNNYIQATEELVLQRPNTSYHWGTFKNTKEAIEKKLQKKEQLKLIRRFAERNWQDACDSLDTAIRLMICKIIDKDYKFEEILTQPFNIRENMSYLEHFCNKLEVNFLIIHGNGHTFVTRSDKNKSPLITLYMENDNSWSILYHQDYELLLTENVVDLDRFPFVYDPRQAPIAVQKPNIKKIQKAQKANQDPSFIAPAIQSTTIPEEASISPQSVLAPEETKVNSPSIAHQIIPGHEETKQPSSQPKIKKFIPQSKEINQEPSSSPKPPEAEEIKQTSIYFPAVEEPKPDPSPSPFIEISTQLISEMASIILLNCPSNCSNQLAKLLSDYTEINPSVNKGDVARLKELASHTISAAQPPAQLPIQPQSPIQPPAQSPIQPPAQSPIQPPAQLPIQPPAQLPIQNMAECGHLKVNYTPICGKEHCAFCLKKIYDEDGKSAVCSHNKKISPKNNSEIVKLISKAKQLNKDSDNVEPIAAQGGNDSAQGFIEASSKPPIPVFPKNADIPKPSPNFSTINIENVSQQGPIQGLNPPNFAPGTSQPIKVINLGSNQQFPEATNIEVSPPNKINLPPPQLPPQPPQKKVIQPSQWNPLQDNAPKIGQQPPHFPQNESNIATHPSQIAPQVAHPPPQPVQIIPPQVAHPQPAHNAPPHPQPRNEIKCEVCKDYKSNDDFIISCPGHQICNICRVKDVEKCQMCQRYYSDNDKQTLEVILLTI